MACAPANSAKAPDAIPSWCPTLFCAKFRAELRTCAEPADPGRVRACTEIFKAADTPPSWCARRAGRSNCFDVDAHKTKAWALWQRGSALAAEGQYDLALVDLREVDRLGPLGGFDDQARAAIAEIQAKLKAGPDAAKRAEAASEPEPPSPPIAGSPPEAAEPGAEAKADPGGAEAASIAPEPEAHSPAIAGSPSGSGEPDAQAKTGSGIIVSAKGDVLTNYHVVEGCREIVLRRARDEFGPAALLYADRNNDLALLRPGEPLHDRAIAALRITPPARNGEDVAVYGFPLPQILSESGNITRGNISSLAGIGNDTRFLQVTAPIQPGNSGGPLLDQAGNVIGIVDAKLSDRYIAAVGQVAQNVNFAIKIDIAATFLEAHGLTYLTATAGNALELPSVADHAARFTVLIVCR